MHVIADVRAMSVDMCLASAMSLARLTAGHHGELLNPLDMGAVVHLYLCQVWCGQVQV